jgi:hypothetical protein
MELVLLLKKQGGQLLFDNVTKNIVSESICTAVFIDNELKEPYTQVENPSDVNFILSKQMYQSFKKQNCLLDFYKYENGLKWDSDKEYILKNKDLIILDWELTDGSLRFIDSLKVLKDSVLTDSLPFVYIYTQESELEKVIYNILSYFSGYSFKDIHEKADTLIDKLEDSPEELLQEFKDKCLIAEELDDSLLFSDSQKFCLDIALISKPLLTNPELKKEIKLKIIEYIETELELERKHAGIFYRIFLDFGMKIFDCKTENDFLKIITLFFERRYFPEDPVVGISVLPVEDEKYTYLIHNTLVKISAKNLRNDFAKPEAVIAENVYSEFSKTICGRPRNFLALLGLEMRNLYRKNASVIGKDINEINELAFFHHQESVCEGADSDFYDFLKDIYKEELSSFFLDQNPILFSALKDYKTKNSIDEKLQKFRKNSNDLLYNLAKLNYFYSVQRIKHDQPRKIRFGDIFSIKFVKDSLPIREKNSYLICITAHCDCLRPNKINDCFHFVVGKEIALNEGLKQRDTDFVSYIKSENELVCIKWDTTPFTLYIPADNNDITETIESYFSGKEVSINHLTCLNENHAQRIANESFSWANRVGISFAKWDGTGGKSK